MKIITTYIGNKEKQYEIYDDHNEFKNSKDADKLRTLANIKPGQYILTHNGFYIPLIKTSRKKYKDRDGIEYYLVKFQFPRYTALTRYYPGNDYYSRIRLIYSLYPKEKKVVLLSNRMKMLVAHYKEGMDIVSAYRLVYQRRGRKADAKLGQIINNKKFIQYMKEQGVMSKFQDELRKSGADEKLLAKTLKATLNDPKTHPDLKKHMFDFLAGVMNVDENPKTNTMSIVESNLEKIKNKAKTHQN